MRRTYGVGEGPLNTITFACADWWPILAFQVGAAQFTTMRVSLDFDEFKYKRAPGNQVGK